jgi:3-phosphoshikimate 1-carboxyvinyltransferase
MISAICAKGGVVGDPLRSEDCERTLAILRELGARVDLSADSVRFHPADFQSVASPLDCGNSGTTMRLLTGLIAGRGVSCELTGDASLQKRPMRRIVEPLRLMGAAVEGDNPPLRISPSSLHGIDYKSPIASAQVKSALLFAGLTAEGRTTITEPALSRDHTERMLAAAGCSVERNGLTVSVGNCRPNEVAMRIPGDISSAAFFFIAAAMLGGPVTARHVGTNPSRTGCLDILVSAGAEVEVLAQESEQGEPVADVTVSSGRHMSAFTIDAATLPRLVDEVPILCVLASQCEGSTHISGAQELRVKESDRLAAVSRGLSAMGGKVTETEDGLVITGPTPLSGATIDACLDHRIAMSFAVAGMIADGETVIDGAETISSSFPGFAEELRRLAID